MEILKKGIIFVAAALSLLTLTACGNDSGKQSKDNGTITESSVDPVKKEHEKLDKLNEKTFNEAKSKIDEQVLNGVAKVKEYQSSLPQVDIGDDVTSWGEATNTISEISKNIKGIIEDNLFQGQYTRQDWQTKLEEYASSQKEKYRKPFNDLYAEKNPHGLVPGDTASGY